MIFRYYFNYLKFYVIFLFNIMIINYNIRNDNNLNNLEDNEYKCYICYDNITENDKDISILKCGHKFHYDCILLTYKNNKTKRECPYCRSFGGYLKLKEGIIPIRNIHKEYNEYIQGNNNVIQYIPNKCNYILKRGKNSGKQCSYNKKYDSFCLKHYRLTHNKDPKKENKTTEQIINNNIKYCIPIEKNFETYENNNNDIDNNITII